MDLTKAFGCVNRKILWTTLYKAGLPIQLIKHIRQGNQNTVLRCKDNRTYGAPIQNNVGVFQGSALSAILFIIYLDDMVQDYQARNDQQLPQRTSIQTSPATHTNNLIQQVNDEQKSPKTAKHGTQHNAENMQNNTRNKEHGKTAREDEIIYADDTNIITKHGTHQNK